MSFKNKQTKKLASIDLNEVAELGTIAQRKKLLAIALIILNNSIEDDEESDDDDDDDESEDDEESDDDDDDESENDDEEESTFTKEEERKYDIRPSYKDDRGRWKIAGPPSDEDTTQRYILKNGKSPPNDDSVYRKVCSWLQKWGSTSVKHMTSWLNNKSTGLNAECGTKYTAKGLLGTMKRDGYLRSVSLTEAKDAEYQAKVRRILKNKRLALRDSRT